MIISGNSDIGIPVKSFHAVTSNLTSRRYSDQEGIADLSIFV